MLHKFGVSPATEARFDLLASIPSPGPEEFKRTEPTTLNLTLGQVQHLRGTLRHALNNAVNAINSALTIAELTGTPVEDMAAESGIDFEDVFTAICDLEDALASAWADATAGSVTFSVPDAVPDGFYL